MALIGLIGLIFQTGLICFYPRTLCFCGVIVVRVHTMYKHCLIIFELKVCDEMISKEPTVSVAKMTREFPQAVLDQVNNHLQMPIFMVG